MFKEIEILESTDKNVFKFVFKSNNAIAEAVLYKYPEFNDRTVICCSVMSGCPVGCRFCGTGDYFVRNLTADEIVQQVDSCLNSKNIITSEIKRFQIMTMSQGEPMLNYKELEKALVILNVKYPNAVLLISTIAPNVDYEPLFRLAEKLPIGLQFSVHESSDEKRNLLIPFKEKKTLKEIAELGKEFLLRTKRKPFFNYCAKQDNISQDDVNRIVELFDPIVFEATISVVCERAETISASHIRQKELTVDFQQKLIDAGYSTRIFDPAGADDIGGGCGQLWHVQKWFKENEDKIKKSCGYGKEMVHSPQEII